MEKQNKQSNQQSKVIMVVVVAVVGDEEEVVLVLADGHRVYCLRAGHAAFIMDNGRRTLDCYTQLRFM